MTRKPQPLDSVEWVDPATLHANSWNPNKVFSPEMALLKHSILEDGWTQPVVAHPDGQIVDGFHRWTLASRDPDIRVASAALVPLVRISSRSAADAMAATVRHNRARGQHGILRMGDIVRAMRAEGMDDARICKMLGMEEEEVERLADERASPERAGRDFYNKGWAPMGNNK